MLFLNVSIIISNVTNGCELRLLLIFGNPDAQDLMMLCKEGTNDEKQLKNDHSSAVHCINTEWWFYCARYRRNGSKRYSM